MHRASLTCRQYVRSHWEHGVWREGVNKLRFFCVTRSPTVRQKGRGAPSGNAPAYSNNKRCLAAAAASGWAYINALAQTRTVFFKWIAWLPPITMFRLAVWAHEAGCLPAGTKQDDVVWDEDPEACAGQEHPWLCSAASLLLSALLARRPWPLCTSW